MNGANDWDRKAGASHWLRPDERIYWRGRPNPSVIFAPQDRYLVPLSLAWTAFAIFWEHGASHEGWGFGTAWGVPFILLGAYMVVGRFFVKVWGRLHTFYAVTSERAVEVRKGGRTLLEAFPPAHAELHGKRDMNRGTMIFEKPSDWQGARRRWSGLALPPAAAPYFRGTGWPGARSFDEVAFFDVDRFQDLVVAARSAGFDASGWAQPALAKPPHRSQASSLAGGARAWAGARLGRLPFSLWSPLPPEEVAARLAQNLTPFRQFGFGLGRRPPYQGSVSGSWVQLGYVGPTRNSWRFVFEGRIVAEGSETRLTGTLGPIRFVAAFSAMWLGFVSLFFFGGLVGLFVELASGKDAVSVLPFVLIPAGMIIGFFALTEFASRSARAEWSIMERWLQQLLEAPG